MQLHLKFLFLYRLIESGHSISLTAGGLQKERLPDRSEIQKTSEESLIPIFNNIQEGCAVIVIAGSIRREDYAQSE